MTVNKADQDCVNAVVAPLVERFGIGRVVTALHAISTKTLNKTGTGDYRNVVALLEQLEHDLLGLTIPALDGVAIKL